MVLGWFFIVILGILYSGALVVLGFFSGRLYSSKERLARGGRSASSDPLILKSTLELEEQQLLDLESPPQVDYAPTRGPMPQQQQEQNEWMAPVPTYATREAPTLQQQQRYTNGYTAPYESVDPYGRTTYGGGGNTNTSGPPMPGTIYYNAPHLVHLQQQQQQQIMSSRDVNSKKITPDGPTAAVMYQPPDTMRVRRQAPPQALSMQKQQQPLSIVDNLRTSQNRVAPVVRSNNNNAVSITSALRGTSATNASGSSSNNRRMQQQQQQRRADDDDTRMNTAATTTTTNTNYNTTRGDTVATSRHEDHSVEFIDAEHQFSAPPTQRRSQQQQQQRTITTA
jgi:hypothetical protein